MPCAPPPCPSVLCAASSRHRWPPLAAGFAIWHSPLFSLRARVERLPPGECLGRQPQDMGLRGVDRHHGSRMSHGEMALSAMIPPSSCTRSEPHHRPTRVYIDVLELPTHGSTTLYVPRRPKMMHEGLAYLGSTNRERRREEGSVIYWPIGLSCVTADIIPVWGSM